LAAVFFKRAPSQAGAAVTVDHKDYADLEQAILQMPSMRIKYQPPSAWDMAQALADKLGIQPEEFEEKLKSERAKVFLELQHEAKNMRLGHQVALESVLLALSARSLADNHPKPSAQLRDSDNPQEDVALSEIGTESAVSLERRARGPSKDEHALSAYCKSVETLEYSRIKRHSLK